MAVVFVDTSILCALLRVPGKDAGHEDVRAEFRTRHAAGDLFILPLTAVIETGNHIEQIEDGLGHHRRRCAEGLCAILRLVADGTAPWVLHRVTWDDRLLGRFCDGGPGSPPFVDVAGPGQLGGGDLSILVERDFYREARAHVPVEVWTLDRRLEAWA
jgi:hypothetical protein